MTFPTDKQIAFLQKLQKKYRFSFDPAELDKEGASNLIDQCQAGKIPSRQAEYEWKIKIAKLASRKTHEEQDSVITLDDALKAAVNNQTPEGGMLVELIRAEMANREADACRFSKLSDAELIRYVTVNQERVRLGRYNTDRMGDVKGEGYRHFDQVNQLAIARGLLENRHLTAPPVGHDSTIGDAAEIHRIRKLETPEGENIVVRS